MDLSSQMTKTIDALNAELKTVRTGRANPSLVENIMVETYGMKMSLMELATINAADAHTITIQAWDLGNLTPIRKAIESSNMGLNPSIDGNNVMRITIPPLTEERRRELVKRVNQIAEEFKKQIRMIRQDEMKDIETQKKAKTISEDDANRQEKAIQDTTNKFNLKLEEIVSAKEAELMQV